MKKSIIFLLLFLVIILLILFVIRIIIPEDKKGQLPPIQIFAPSTTPTKTISPSVVEDLKVTSVEPPEDPTGSKNYFPGRRIIFTFNKEVNIYSFEPNITPTVEYRVVVGKEFNKFFIEPKPPKSWEPDVTYTIVIPKGAKALDGSELKNDYIYKIQTKLQGGV